ncbi:hypothetical protein KM043_018700 [Ampulex compressa]|nr:hypothetical protein KM043_018700 [Ampulex compressa]
MTYMFEYPQYVRISLDDDIQNKYPRFALYAYGEGFITEKLRRMHFSGIPVLFIPGNAGSHEQVRSLASVSLRKSLKDRTPFHFDFFTVSFSKDYSALYGGVLMEETMYVAHCIERILKLYKGNMDNVVLIGHSMGGVIAKGAILLAPNTNISLASIIISLATPHRPTLVLDNTLANYYRDVENQLHQIKDSGIILISIGGGPRDILVTSAQTVDSMADIDVVSTGIPDVWKSTDHLSILWCKQLVLSIIRSLFDCVNHMERPPKLLPKTEDRIKVLSYHLLHHTSGKRVYHHKDKFLFEPGGEWIENTRKMYTWYNKKVSRTVSPIYLAIKVDGHSDHLSIEAMNLETKDWLFACTASNSLRQSSLCEWGWNFTNKTRISPDPLHRNRKIADLNLKEIKYSDITHIVVRIHPDDLDKYVTFIMPSLTKSENGSIRYYAAITDTTKVIAIELKATGCADVKHHGFVELLEQQKFGATQIRFFTVLDNGPKSFKVQTGFGNSYSFPILRITLDPECLYVINIKEGSIIDQLSCIENTPIIVVTAILSIYHGLFFDCCIALAILFVFSVALCASIIFLGSVAHSIAVRFLARAIAFSTTWSDWLLGGLNQLPLITAILVLSIIPATCGALAMLISVFLYFLKLTRMYEDYLEELLMASLQHFNWITQRKSNKNGDANNKSENTRQKIFNHLILFLLWCFTAIPAIPTVLVWAKNFSYDMRLSTENPLLLKSWMMLVTCSTLGFVQISPTSRGSRSQALTSILYFISWLVLALAATPEPSFYQCYMPPIVAFSVAFIVLNHIIP